MNCIIIDDEATARAIISKLCDGISSLTALEEFPNAIQAIKYLNQNEADLIFLDIHMPDFTGFDGGTLTVEAVAAPQSTGNSSTNLAKLVRNGGQAWAGAFAVVDSNLDFTTKKYITAKLWTDAPIGTKIMFKTEQDTDAGNNSGEKDTFTTKTGEWVSPLQDHI